MEPIKLKPLTMKIIAEEYRQRYRNEGPYYDSDDPSNNAIKFLYEVVQPDFNQPINPETKQWLKDHVIEKYQLIPDPMMAFQKCIEQWNRDRREQRWLTNLNAITEELSRYPDAWFYVDADAKDDELVYRPAREIARGLIGQLKNRAHIEAQFQPLNESYDLMDAVKSLQAGQIITQSIQWDLTNGGQTVGQTNSTLTFTVTDNLLAQKMVRQRLAQAEHDQTADQYQHQSLAEFLMTQLPKDWSQLTDALPGFKTHLQMQV